MIEKVFTKNSIKNALVLKNCTLYINLDYYDIGTTYLFRNQTSHKVEEFSNDWVVDNIWGELFNKGYFSSPPYPDFMFGGKLLSSDNVSIFGYSGNTRYFVSGVFIGNNKMNNNFICKFSFLDLTVK